MGLSEHEQRLLDEMERNLYKHEADIVNTAQRIATDDGDRHDRSSDDVLERCEELGIGFIPWFPLDTGALATDPARGTLGRIARRQHPARVRLEGAIAVHQHHVLHFERDVAHRSPGQPPLEDLLQSRD